MRAVELKRRSESPRELACVDGGGKVAFLIFLQVFPGYVTARWRARAGPLGVTAKAPGECRELGRRGDAREPAGVRDRTAVRPL